jgi:hypothetical protein
VQPQPADALAGLHHRLHRDQRAVLAAHAGLARLARARALAGGVLGEQPRRVGALGDVQAAGLELGLGAHRRQDFVGGGDVAEGQRGGGVAGQDGGHRGDVALEAGARLRPRVRGQADAGQQHARGAGEHHQQQQLAPDRDVAELAQHRRAVAAVSG